MNKEQLREFVKDAGIESYLNDLLSISRIHALRFFILEGKQFLKFCDDVTPEDKNKKLHKSDLIDSMEKTSRVGYIFKMPDELAEKFAGVIGKMMRKMYLDIESNGGLTACKKLEVGNFIVDTFDTINFYYNENIAQYLLDVNYIKQKNSEYEELCREENKPIEVRIDITEDELLQIQRAWEKAGILNGENKTTDSPLHEEDKTITISQDIIEPLSEILIMYFNEDIITLKFLFQGKRIGRKLLFQTSGNKLVAVLLKLKEGQKIVENKTEMNEWICSNFQYLNPKDKSIKDFDKEYVWKILTGQRTVTKQSRINLDKLKLST